MRATPAAAVCSHFLHGWRFWSLEGSSSEPATKAATKTKTSNKAGVKPKTSNGRRNGRKSAHRIIRPTEHQEDVPEGQIRYWCDAGED